MCPEDLVDKARQFVTLCKKKQQAFMFLLSPRFWKYHSQRVVHYAKKMQIIQALRHLASGGGPTTGQADWCSVTGYCSNQRA